MRLVTSAVMATLALTLSACGGDDPPPPEPTTSATTPANPDATLPPMPEVAEEFTPNGAATFVRHYVSVMDYASKTGDVSELSRLSDPDCGGCQDYITLFGDTYESGGYLKGRDWSSGPTDLQFDRNRDDESFATTTIRVTAGINRRSAEDDEKRVPESNDRVSFALIYLDGWTITQFGIGDVG